MKFIKGELINVKGSKDLCVVGDRNEYSEDFESTGWMIDEDIKEYDILKNGTPVLYCNEITETVCIYDNDKCYVVKYRRGWKGSSNHIENFKIDPFLIPDELYHYTARASIKPIKRVHDSISELFPIY